jgi:methanogenic corrinoid protein MtbC1
LSETEQRLQQLKKSLLEGSAEEARLSTNAALATGGSANEILDALVDAVNITVDLSDVGEYDQSRVAAVENAVTSCLQVIDDTLASSESKFNIKATTGPLGIKAGSLLSTAVCASLRSVGFRAVNLGKSQTPLELLRNSEELGASLVIPLLSGERVEEQLQGFIEVLDRGGFRAKFEVIPVAPGLPESVQASVVIARNSGEAISKATEWALKRQGLSRIK